MKRTCAGSAILGGLLGWLACLAVPAGCLAAAAPRAGQAGAHAPGTASAPAAAPAGSAAPATPGDQATLQPAAPQAGAVWFLSATQERQLRRIGQAARRWHAALAPLAVAAQQQGDAVLQGELVKLDTLLRQLESGQQMTFAAYVAALAARNQALTLWAANSAYVGPREEQAWQQADAGAAELATAAETGFVFGADLSSGSVVTYAESAPGDKRGAAGDDGVSTGPESAGAGSGTGEAASGEPAPESGGPMADGPAVPASGSGYGDPVQEAAAATPGVAGSGDAGPMPGASTAALPAEAGGIAGEVPVPEADSGAPVPTAAMASLGSGSAAPGWVVIHGGPVAGQAEGPSEGALPAGDVQEQLPPLNLQEPGAGDDPDAGAAAAALLLAWEEICRPWQPAAVRPALCPLQPASAGNL
jgi:hypothetical protein